ncbi:MAG: BamA/TamA family outer membrane protein [Bacteroidaceae bacterium]|nr:BamA/TamA family outer membrane protein [Bacteroidaceae bacterium]
MTRSIQYIYAHVRANVSRLHRTPLGLLVVLVALAACSTTSNLPEGELLYTGIREIRYNEDFSADSSSISDMDNTGVITSVANAARAVDAALNGQSYSWAEAFSRDSLTRQERRAYRQRVAQEKAEFATAQAEIDALLAYPPNGSLMGSSSLRSPLNIGLWLYNGLVNDSSKLSQWIFKNFATQPVLISSVAPETRTKVATNTLHNYGYFQGVVDHRIHTLRNPRKARVSYRVITGPLYRFDSIAYIGFTPEVDSLLQRTSTRTYVKSGEGFSAVALSDERTRISELLRNRGYYYYSPSYITYLADTFQRQNFVQLQIKQAETMPYEASHPWYIGHTYIDIRTAQGAPLTNTRTFTGRRRRDAQGATTATNRRSPSSPARSTNTRRRRFTPTTFRWNGDSLTMPLRAYLWRDALFFSQGDRYSLRRETSSLTKLNEMGVFSQIDLQFMPADTTALCDTLDVYVTAVLDKPYDSSLELDATLKSNSQLGPALTYTLSKRNAFRGGENVSFKIFGSYEWQLGTGGQESNSLLNSYDFGTSLSFEFPRFVLPFINRRKLQFPATTTFSLEADWRNRSGFYQMLTYSLVADYAWRKKRTISNNVDLRLDFTKRLSSTTEFDNILAANPVLDVSMRDYFVPSMAYTFTYNASRQHHNPVYLQVGVKESGNLLSGAYALFGSPLHEKDKQLFGNPFAQFVKLTGEIHRTQNFRNRLQLVTRFFAGAIFSYGNMLRAPYAEQFYVGGANSVRGFTVRSIGPGRFRSADTRYSYVDQTGDIKLEANVELRAHLFGSLYGAVFLDAGNVWLARKDEMRPDAEFTMSNLRHIALGTGAGLRYDLEFLVLRLDLGVGLHAPYDTGKTGYFNMPKFKDALALHFAIGYPF